jgi:hypothetical protein
VDRDRGAAVTPPAKSNWLITVLFAAALAWGRPAPDNSDYVDSALCAACHQKLADTYRLTGMGHSMYRMNSSTRLEDFQTRHTLEHKASGRVYEMIERGGRFFQRRYETGFDGKLENVDEKQIDFVVGSGNHARTYLHRTVQGQLIELPVSWYSEKGGYWAMSPGYDRRAPEDFRRSIPAVFTKISRKMPPCHPIPNPTLSTSKSLRAVE